MFIRKKLNRATLVPIGTDCLVVHYLRSQGMRVQAYLFDWNVTTPCCAIELMKNGFDEFISEENLLFLPSTKRKLFSEKNLDLKIAAEVITPVICQRYEILFPHDFSSIGRQDLPSVRRKYERRTLRLIKLLNTSKKSYLFLT